MSAGRCSWPTCNGVHDDDRSGFEAGDIVYAEGERRDFVRRGHGWIDADDVLLRDPYRYPVSWPCGPMRRVGHITITWDDVPQDAQQAAYEHSVRKTRQAQS